MGDDSVGLGDGDQIGPLLDERTAELVFLRTVCVSRAASTAAGLGHVEVVPQMDNADARLLWVATHGGGLIGVDPERGAITRVVTV
jgi:hypothetical protein